MCDVSSTVGLTRCYKTEGFYAFIIGIVRSLIVDVAMGQIPRSTERISSYKTEVF